MKDNFLKFLGLVRRSGNIVMGGNLVEGAVKRGRIRFMVIAEDASENTLKKFLDLSRSRNIESVQLCTKDELGYALGKGEISVIGVTDINMTKKLKEITDMCK